MDTPGDLLGALRRSFGFDSFRPHQEPIVRAILGGRDVFAALPTGGGKSLCYQLPAVVRGGLSVVVSPLIALMKDQVDGAREDGIAAVHLDSTQDAEQARAAWREAASGRARLLYVSPERLSAPGFREALARLSPGLFAVDEAHCISEWGHEFRPDYRALGTLRADFPGAVIAAFTATATSHVQADVIRLLGLRDPLVVRASFDRPEIFYRVVPREGDGDAQIRAFIEERPGQPGIVYRGTRRAVESTTAFLAGHGVSAVGYHAGMEDGARHAAQEAFIRDEAAVVVATIAFGMGIDKSNVRWIVHGDLPRSLEGYYQETGRCGRDGEDAEALLLHGARDIPALRWHINKLEDDGERARAEQRLQDMLAYAASTECRRIRLLAHFGEAHPGACGRCDVCAGEVATVDLTTEARKVLSAAARTGERFGAHHLADILVGAATDKVIERGHDALPTFGVGRDRDRDWWLSFIRDLAGAGYLARGDGKTAGFEMTARGRMLLAGKASFAAARAAAAPRAGGRGRRRAAGPGAADGPVPAGEFFDLAAAGPATEAEEALFQCLKALRRSIAQARGLPPYVVFGDKSLRAMARNRPVDEAAFLRCHGVGERKLEVYGRPFMDAIREFVRTGQCAP